jgi:hypothetical protein
MELQMTLQVTSSEEIRFRPSAVGFVKLVATALSFSDCGLRDRVRQTMARHDPSSLFPAFVVRVTVLSADIAPTPNSAPKIKIRR